MAKDAAGAHARMSHVTHMNDAYHTYWGIQEVIWLKMLLEHMQE